MGWHSERSELCSCRPETCRSFAALRMTATCHLTGTEKDHAEHALADHCTSSDHPRWPQRCRPNLTKLYMPIVSTWRVYDGRGFAQERSVPLIAHGGLNRDASIREERIWLEVTRQLDSIHRRGPG
jgi:hypothetical protein